MLCVDGGTVFACRFTPRDLVMAGGWIVLVALVITSLILLVVTGGDDNDIKNIGLVGVLLMSVLGVVVGWWVVMRVHTQQVVPTQPVMQQ